MVFPNGVDDRLLTTVHKVRVSFRVLSVSGHVVVLLFFSEKLSSPSQYFEKSVPGGIRKSSGCLEVLGATMKFQCPREENVRNFPLVWN